MNEQNNAAKHTLGPWTVLEHDGEVFVVANGAMTIATITYVIEHAGEQGSRRMQNARVMAAGPELLEALKKLLPLAKDALVHPELSVEILDASAAIAKATGSAA